MQSSANFFSVHTSPTPARDIHSLNRIPRIKRQSEEPVKNLHDGSNKRARVSSEFDNNSFTMNQEEDWDNDTCDSQPVQTQWYGNSDHNNHSNNNDWGNNSRDDYMSQGFRGRARGRGRGGDRGGHFRRNDNNSSFNDKTTMEIDSNQVGRIIGRGGTKIRELEEQSGARIKINKNFDGGPTCVELSGPSNARSKAQDMINEILSGDLYRPRQQQDRGGFGKQWSSGNDRCDERQETIPTEENNEQTVVINDEEVSVGKIDWTKAAREHEEFQKQKWSKYPDIIKNFYVEDPEVANFSKEQVAEIRLKNNKTEVQWALGDDGFKIPNPVVTFEQAFRPYPDILTEIRKQGFEKPSPIQSQAWPILLSGKDVIGIAQTGTGKTLAFLLPALLHIDGQTQPRSERVGPTVLVMAPTRELAQQIEKEVNKYSYRGIKAVCVYGGGDRKSQISKIGRGVEIVIATPGRLNDLCQAGELEVSCVSYLVLDEADRMLDMGFEPEIRKTLLDVRPDRHTVMTSATWPAGVRRLAASYMKNPVTVHVGSLDLAAVQTVSQTIHMMDEEDKPGMLRQFFAQMEPHDKVIVFFGRKTTVDSVGSDLALQGVYHQSIHGGRDQCDREQALKDIKDGTVRILLATDVASRGLDIEDITYVLNYDIPRDAEEYVHRVGRTGRAGRTGEAVSFFTRSDWAMADELVKILENAQQGVPEELYSMADRFKAHKKKREEEERLYGGRRGGRGGGRGGQGGRNRYRN